MWTPNMWKPNLTVAQPGATIAALWLTAATLVTGCGSGPPAAAPEWGFSSDVSPNGAVHVINTPPPGDGAPTWLIEEEVRIGAIDEAGPASLTTVLGLVVTRDGRIAVLEGQAQEVRVFGADGAPLATFGGKGAGPGELEGAFGLMRDAEDLLWVPDYRNARMSVYDPGAGFLRSYPLRLISRGFIWNGVIASDGRILKPSRTSSEPRLPLLRVYDRELALVDSIPFPPEPEIDPENPPNSFYYEFGDGLYGYRQVPFYPSAQQLLDPAGPVWATEFGDPSYRIFRWTPGGDTTLVLETRRPFLPVRQAERDSLVDAIRTELEQSGASPRQDWSKIPSVKPSVASMSIAEDGRLWVRRPSEDSLTHYDVYDRDGRWQGDAATALEPWPYLPPVVRGDRFWAVVTDGLGVPYVVQARLRAVDDP